ncbi:MAG: preprotein translocase subunit SecE [Proteobacteria bacterium]|nr:preprotein translocase subunit SecE [Pseudomonadota bacterium]
MKALKALINYIKSVRLEWFKITWASRESVVRATIMIFVFAALVALFLFIVDSILNGIVGWIF